MNHFQRRPHVPRSLLCSCIFLTLLAAGLARAGVTRATPTAATGCPWVVQPSPNPVPNGNVLADVAALSAQDIWSVGYFLDRASALETLTEHWDGSRWSIVGSANPLHDNLLTGVAAVSATDVWAVGYSVAGSGSVYRALIEHWDGTHWRTSASPAVGTQVQLFRVAAVGANDIWAVGTNGTQALIEHWDGTHWRVVSSPTMDGQVTIYDVAALSGANIWAVGNVLPSQGPSQTLIEHWSGKRWRIVKSPSPGSYAELFAVSTLSASDLWAVGGYGGVNNLTPLAEHWDGRQWSVVASPGKLFDTVFEDVVALSSQQVWAVGFFSTGGSPETKTLIEQWDGTRWHIVSSPNPGSDLNRLAGVTRVPRTQRLWAVGTAGDPGAQHTLTASHC